MTYSIEVPELCRFLGIVIGMFYREHGPAHFHAVYGEFDITVEIESGIVNGKFPQRALTHVLEWHGLHREELMDNWRLMEERKPLKENSTAGVDRCPFEQSTHDTFMTLCSGSNSAMARKVSSICEPNWTALSLNP